MPSEHHPLYAPLQLLNDHSIRILSFSSDNNSRNSTSDSPLSAQLRVFDLDGEPEFAALSYCWGPPGFSHTISCVADISSNNLPIHLPITKTLHSALIRLRNLGVQRIWVDQICIDQSNVVERGQQVQLMRRIYSQASRTFLYLGEVDDEPAVYLTGVRILAHAQDQVNGDRKDIGPDLTRPQNKIQRFRQDLAEHRRQKAILKETKLAVRAWHGLAQRPCFTRKWIIQEVVLSRVKTLVIGPETIDWDLFKVESNMVAYRLRMGYSFARARREAERVQQHVGFISSMARFGEQGKRVGLLDLLKLSRFFDASDERDVVYGLLGLAHDADILPLPDYNTSVEDIFREFSKSLILNGHTSQIFCLAGIHERRTTDLPSWAVDWRTLRDTYIPSHYSHYTSSSDPATFEFSSDNRTLRTTARFITSVVAASAPIKGQRGTVIESYISKCHQAFAEYYTSDTDPHAVYKAAFDVVCVPEEDRISTPRSSVSSIDSIVFEHRDLRTRKMLDSYRQNPALRTTDPRQLYTSFRLVSRMAARKLERHLQHKSGRKTALACRILAKLRPDTHTPRQVLDELFAGGFYDYRDEFGVPSERVGMLVLASVKAVFLGLGRLGLCHERAEVGDWITVVGGVGMPVVLRACEDRGKWRLVGPAFVKGFMKGEACEGERYPLREVELV